MIPHDPGCSFNPTRQPYEVAFRRCHCGVRPRGSETKEVYNRAPDMLLPGKHDQVIANRDRLIFDGIGESDIVPRDDLHRQLASE